MTAALKANMARRKVQAALRGAADDAQDAAAPGDTQTGPADAATDRTAPANTFDTQPKTPEQGQG